MFNWLKNKLKIKPKPLRVFKSQKFGILEITWKQKSEKLRIQILLTPDELITENLSNFIQWFEKPLNNKDEVHTFYFTPTDITIGSVSFRRSDILCITTSERKEYIEVNNHVAP